MSEKKVNKYVGLVDYQELESNILSSIREGRPLTGRDGVLTPLIKKLLEASLEGEMENNLSNNSNESSTSKGCSRERKEESRKRKNRGRRDSKTTANASTRFYI